MRLSEGYKYLASLDQQDIPAAGVFMRASKPYETRITVAQLLADDYVFCPKNVMLESNMRVARNPMSAQDVYTQAVERSARTIDDLYFMRPTRKQEALLQVSDAALDTLYELLKGSNDDSGIQPFEKRSMVREFLSRESEMGKNCIVTAHEATMDEEVKHTSVRRLSDSPTLLRHLMEDSVPTMVFGIKDKGYFFTTDSVFDITYTKE